MAGAVGAAGAVFSDTLRVGKNALDALARVNIPTALFGPGVADEMSHSLIDNY